MPPQSPWTIHVYETETGEKLVWAFIEALEGRDRTEAIATRGTREHPSSATFGRSR